MRIIKTICRGELFADAYDGQGDPAFFGSQHGSVVVAGSGLVPDDVIETYVELELRCTYARLEGRMPDGCALVRYADF